MLPITNTKLSQGQIKGKLADGSSTDLGAELSAVEAAIKAAVGGANFSSAPVIDLAEVGAMINKDGNGKMELLVDVAGAGHAVAGLSSIAASSAAFANTDAGALVATSAAVTNAVTAGSAAVAGLVDAGSLMVQNAGQAKGGFVVGTGTGDGPGTGDLTVWGDLIVKGSTTTLDTTQLVVEDDLIVIAKNQANKDGAGFVLGSEQGAHKMVWDASVGVSKWSVSDGIVTPDLKAGGKVVVDSAGVKTLGADDLAFVAGDMMSFKDSLMAAALDFSHAGEYDAIFGAVGVQGWAAGTEGLLGLFTKVKSDAATALAGEVGAREAAVLAEKQRAEGIEAGLRTDLNSEISRAQTAEGNLHSEIVAENSRAVAAEGLLQDAIDAENVRAVAAEGLLQDAIDAEASTRVAADIALGGRIDTEISDRQSAISTEASARAAADTALGGRIDTEISDRQTAVSNEASARSSADTALGGRIDALSLLEGNHYAELDGKITAEAGARVAGDATTLASAKSYTDAEVLTEKNRAMGVESQLNNAIATEVNARIADVNAEESRALAAEGVLDGKITSEKNRAQSAEQTLQNNITALTNAIAAQSKVLKSQTVGPNGVAKIGNVMWGPGVSVAGWALPASKEYTQVDVFLNGQFMQHGSDFSFAPKDLIDPQTQVTSPNPAAGQLQFAFDLVQGDLIVIREH